MVRKKARFANIVGEDHNLASLMFLIRTSKLQQWTGKEAMSWVSCREWVESSGKMSYL